MLRSVDQNADGRLNRREFEALVRREPMTLHGAKGSAVDDMSVVRIVPLDEAQGSTKLQRERVQVQLGSEPPAPLRSMKQDYCPHPPTSPPRRRGGEAQQAQGRCHYYTGPPGVRHVETSNSAHGAKERIPNPRVWARDEKTKSSVWQSDGETDAKSTWQSSTRQFYRPTPPCAPSEMVRQRTETKNNNRRANWSAGTDAVEWKTTGADYGGTKGDGGGALAERRRNAAALRQSSVGFGSGGSWQTTARSDFLPPLSARGGAEASHACKAQSVFFGGAAPEYKTTARGAFKAHRFVSPQKMTDAERQMVTHDISPRMPMSGSLTAR